MQENKTSLRKSLIEKRQRIERTEANTAAGKIAENLLELIPKNTKIAGYWPIRGEINVLPALNQLFSSGHKIALPEVTEGNKALRFLEYNPDSKLVIGKFSVPCPAPESTEIIPDVIIVPMVGFDTQKFRLGYGGGYYDTTIPYFRAKNSSLLVIGAAYDFQETNDFAPETHDEKMDIIVTESRILR